MQMIGGGVKVKICWGSFSGRKFFPYAPVGKTLTKGTLGLACLVLWESSGGRRGNMEFSAKVGGTSNLGEHHVNKYFNMN